MHARIEVIRLMNNISLVLAFSAGFLSFLSPCVLPLIPAYISYLLGGNLGNEHHYNSKFNTLYKSFGFAIGFSLIFILMGVSITTLGKLIITNQTLLRRAGGLLIFIFGIHTTGIFKIKFLYYEKRFISFNKIGRFSSIFMGMAFAAGWTPCVGPILSSILIYAANMNTIGNGVLLLVFYSLGLAIPFILTAYTIEEFSKYIRKFSKYLPIVSLLSGTLMIIMGILVFTNNVNKLSGYFNFINF